MIPRLVMCCLGSVAACHAASILPGGKPRGGDPWDAWEVTVESGYAWEIGHNTPLDYQIVPTQLTLRGPRNFTWWERADGGRLVVRPRFSLLTEAIVKGPEDHYFGVSLAPSIEYWFPSRKTSLWFSIGGGVGVINSGHVPGGQGQDLTLNWFAGLGVRQALSEDLSLLGGLHFVHHSNGGMTNPNPGIDALGFTVGLARRF